MCRVKTFKQSEDVFLFFLFCLNIIFFPFSTVLQKLQKILLYVSQKTKVKFTLIFEFKRFPPTPLNVCFFPSGASVSVWIFCDSCIWVPQLSSVWKDWSQNHTVIVGKGSKYTKMLDNLRICGTWRIFWEQQAVNCSGQQGTHEQLSLNRKHSCGSFR